MTKRDLADYYVGELYLLEGPNVLNTENLLRIIKGEQPKIIQNGAISLEFPNSNYIGVLTIFCKQGDKFICLHNGKIYSTTGCQCCKNLVSLVECLPKYGYKKPENLTTKDALVLFDQLFNQKKFPYTNEEYNTKDFYLGSLNLYLGEFEEDDYVNLHQHYLLMKNKAATGIYFGSASDTTAYGMFSCVCLKLNDEEFYNLNDHQFYTRSSFDEKKHILKNGSSYFSWYAPLILCAEELDGIKKIPQEITIPNAIKLGKKLYDR